MKTPSPYASASVVVITSPGNMRADPSAERPASDSRSKRRPSRFDPKAQEDDEDEVYGYGELGPRHPLRRVSEEGKVNLPGIRALFGPERPNTPSNFATPSLPSLGSPSTSPSTARTSRYSSTTSSAEQTGWWEPISPMPPNYRVSSFQNAIDERDQKRRRSDQPGPSRDAEEQARLRYQAQSRNASFPLSGSISGSSLRSPSTAMSRGSMSGSSGDYQADSRPSSSRNASIVGGHLSHAFADLLAVEPSSPMPTPQAHPSERRPSAFFSTSTDLPPRLPPPPGLGPDFVLAQPPSTAERLRRLSVRPSTAESSSAARPSFRRSSLTEIIMTNTGDAEPPQSTLRPSVSEPATRPVITGWREPIETVINLNEEDPLPVHIRNSPKPDTDTRGMEMLAEVSEKEVRKPEDEDKASGPKYACKHCAKVFTRPSSLRIHTYSHTGERPYACKTPGCDRRFSVRSNLKRHAKVHDLGVPGHTGGASLNQLSRDDHEHQFIAYAPGTGKRERESGRKDTSDEEDEEEDELEEED